MKLLVTKADTLWKASKGLIGYTHPIALFFKTRFGIHTFGLRFPIDVLILDTKNCVVICKKNLRPNRVFFWHPKWNRVVELPAGIIATRHITIGTPLHLVFTN